jgi:CHASE2 domain-containing sensor protein
MLAVISGICAAAYLVMRHACVPNSVTPTRATAVAALSFGLAGAVITIFPLDVGWLPLIAPFGLLGAFAIATHPYMRHRNQS